jgi:Kef-type K+ transport system membrane component KefB
MQGLESLLLVTLVAALTPMIVAALPGPGIPQVVILILAGVLIGPQGLGLADTTGIKLISNVGLGFLFLLARYELDPRLLRAHAGRLAIIGWLISAIIAVGAVGTLGSFGFLRAYVPIGLALTTTALGTLLPILHDHHMLSGDSAGTCWPRAPSASSSRSWPSRCFSPGAASSSRSPRSSPWASWPSC